MAVLSSIRGLLSLRNMTCRVGRLGAKLQKLTRRARCFGFGEQQSVRISSFPAVLAATNGQKLICVEKHFNWLLWRENHIGWSLSAGSVPTNPWTRTHSNIARLTSDLSVLELTWVEPVHVRPVASVVVSFLFTINETGTIAYHAVSLH